MMQARRYKAIMAAAESFVKNALAAQVLDESNSDYGGFRCPDLLVCEPWAAANAFITMTVLFFNQDSQYYRSSELFQRMKLALQFITRSQYEDGTIDAYFSGEMRAASNVAFAMNSLIKAYKLFHREASNGETLGMLESFLRKGVEALKSKPMSAANQQWVAASVLVEFDKLFLDHSAVARADDYLSNSIDINHDGLYSERSPALGMISNEMLLNIAKKLNRPYLMEHVRRNLNLNLYNFCSDGEVITKYSLRPESESGMPQGYGVWKEMSIVDHNGYYASAGDMVLDMFLHNMRDGYVHYHINSASPNFRQEGNSRFFATSSIGELLIVEDEFNNDAIHRLPLPGHYKRVFADSNIVRIKNSKMNATIMGDNGILLSLRNGQVIIDGFRIRYTYYGHRDFLPRKLEVTTRSYILRDWFNQWQTGPTQERVEPIDVDLQILTEFTPSEDGFDIDVSAMGQKGVPLQLEFGIRKQGTLTMNGDEYDLSTTDQVFMDSGNAVIKAGDDRLKISGGVVQHRVCSPGDSSAMSSHVARLLITPLTPFIGKIQIMCE
ncbi:hypothetical protein ACFL6S_19210 [Candidatus Poribacteria bacterium]